MEVFKQSNVHFNVELGAQTFDSHDRPTYRYPTPLDPTTEKVKRQKSPEP